MLKKRFVVNADGSGDYTSLKDAINAVSIDEIEPALIELGPGIYHEKVIVPEGKWIHIHGAGAEQTILLWGDYAQKIHSDGKEYGTFRTPTLTVFANYFHAEQMTIANDAGYGPNIGQAVAMSVTSEGATFDHVRILGNQDTLFTGGIGRQYYHACYIEGHVDYIFGPAPVVFDQCHIHSLRKGFITAASTPENTELGYVFLDCIVTGCGENMTFLGRPWRPFGSVTFIRAWIDRSIYPKGWDNWRNPDNEQTARFTEYESFGPGAQLNERVNWAHVRDIKEIPNNSTLAFILKTPDWTTWSELS